MRDAQEIPMCYPGKTVTPWGSFVCEETKPPKTWGKEWPLQVEVNPKALEGTGVRLRKEGDRIFPLGAPGNKSLSDYFIDKKIAVRDRDAAPLLVCGNQVSWAVGHAHAQQADAKGCEVLYTVRFMPGEQA